jgi:phage gp36-like protein
MAYTVEADLVAEAGGVDELNELIPTTAPGLSDPEEIRDYWIAEAIRRGDDQLDAYIRARYKTPLAEPSPHVVRLAAEAAVYWLWTVKGNVPPERVTQAEIRMEEFRRIREGEIWPGEPLPDQTSGRQSTVVASTSAWRMRNLGRIL